MLVHANLSKEIYWLLIVDFTGYSGSCEVNVLYLKFSLVPLGLLNQVYSFPMQRNDIDTI